MTGFYARQTGGSREGFVLISGVALGAEMIAMGAKRPAISTGP